MIFVVGISAYVNLPREEKPEMTKPIIKVSTNYSGVAPSEMESLVTDIVENSISGIEGISEISSVTSSGSSQVNIFFDETWDMEKATADVTAAVNNLDLPDGASSPKISSMNSVEAAIMNITISGDYSLVELKNMAESLEKEINTIDGISETNLSGGLDPVINIYLDKQKLEMYDLTLQDVSQVIKNAQKENPIGSDEIDTLEYSIRLVGELNTVESLDSFIVSELDGFPIYLKDVAVIKEEFKEPETISERYDAELQDDKEMISAVFISVHRESDSDVIGISEQIHAILDNDTSDLFPEDVNVIISNEDAVNVEEALDDVLSNALSGLLLVIVVLFIFIGFKESLIVAFVIPLSLFISFVLMSIVGISLNTMSMVALILALGMLVDNAIVIMENIDRIRDEGNDIISSAKIATNQVAPAVLAATLTTVSAFIPISLAGGTLGQMMSCIPLVVIFAIVASFVMSIVVTPALCSRFLSKHKSNKKLPVISRILSIVVVCILTAIAFNGSYLVWISVPLFALIMVYKMFFTKPKDHTTNSHGRIIDKYGVMLRKIIKSKVNVFVWIIVTIVVFASSIFMITSGELKIELMPKRDSTALNISSTIPSGYLIEDAVAIADQMEPIILSYDEVLSVVSKVSSSSVSYSIEIVPVEERDISSTELIDNIRTDLETIVGANIVVGQTLRGFQGSTYPVMIEILGENSDDVNQVSNDFVEMLKNTMGTTEVSSTLVDGPPEIQLSVNEEAIFQYGLSASSIATTIKENISPTTVTTIVSEGDEIEISLLYEGNLIDSISDYSSITFQARDGSTVYFDQVVDIEESKGLLSIKHQDLKRIETVNSQIEDEYTATEVLDSFMIQVENYNVPNGVEIVCAGENEDINETFSNLFLSMGVAVFLVFTILAIQFNSLSQPIVVLFTIPLATIGAIWGLILTGNNFSTYAFFGVVSLVGIAVNDAIVLIDYFNYLRKEEGLSLIDAIVEGGKTRFIPVFSTTITTIGGVLPLALKSDEYAQLGFALIFGLMVATVLTLVVIPMLYMIFEKSKTSIRKYIPIMLDER
jgi:HAE1 family hydrophobic/amphiphilic exporter-1